MNMLIFSSSPNKDGLTAACALSAWEGCSQARGLAEVVYLNDFNISL